MKCPECGETLIIAKNEPDVAIVNNNIESYDVITMVCQNSRIDPVKKAHVCSLYAGRDLSNPLKVAATIRNTKVTKPISG